VGSRATLFPAPSLSPESARKRDVRAEFGTNREQF
jgi:hypothetical protein